MADPDLELGRGGVVLIALGPRAPPLDPSLVTNTIEHTCDKRSFMENLLSILPVTVLD